MENEAFRSSRAKYWDLFLQIGLPHRKTESFQYLPLNQLYAGTYAIPAQPALSFDSLTNFIYPECAESLLVFINGEFCEKFSRKAAIPSQLIISPFSQAVKTYHSFLSNRWTKSLKEEKDCFAALNGALHGEGVFIYLPPKLKINAPIQILHVIDANEDMATLSPRIQVFAGAQSEATFLSSTALLSKHPCWVNQLIDFSIEEGASIVYNSTIKNPRNSWHFEAIRAQLKKNSQFKSVNVTTQGKISRQDYRVYLTGDNAEASLYGLCSLDERSQSHVNVHMEHQAPNCRSLQLFKGVLDGVSRSSFEGKIYVLPDAQKTDAFQLNKHLLLSEHTIANSKPNLEIFADDVKASHGSTVGQMDPEHVFYLKARGLSEKESKQLLIQGFNQEISDLLAIKTIRENCLKCYSEN
jgi:Fe-S cluster assembly protein SufD